MFKHILVPVDGSEPSNHALRTAVSLARETGARMRLVHVLDNAAFVTGFDPSGGSSAQLFEAVRGSGQRILDEGVLVARGLGVQVDHVLFDRGGIRLAEAVAQAATEAGADLIVVGTHGRRGPTRLLLGSGAEQIIRLAPVPVLVTREPAAG